MASRTRLRGALSECPTCAAVGRGDVVLVPVSAEILRRLVRDGWSAPVQIRIDPAPVGPGWEMTCRSVSYVDLMETDL